MIHNIGIFLGHPAHFHNLKYVADNLQKDGYNIFFAIKEKDILTDLCNAANYSFYRLRAGRGNNKLALAKSVLEMECRMIRFVKKYHIDMLVGTTLSFAAAKLCRIPVLVIAEDDYYIAPRYMKMVYPYATEICSPISCNNGQWEKKSIKYPGYQKLAYLHPRYFTPDKMHVEKYGINPQNKYFIMRFAKLNAHHDAGVSGITTDIAQHLIDLLTPYGNVYITSERPLEPQFEQYRLKINPLDIHHVMYFSTMYMGDSQSMAVEAAMLGVPSLRFNDFVGDKQIGVMEELEKVYGLTFGISSQHPDVLYDKIKELLAIPDLRSVFQKRRQRMLNDKIDVTSFLTWLIEEYPQSAIEAKQEDFNWHTLFQK